MATRKWDKWSKHKALRKHEELKSVLPETHWMTEAAFSAILDKHGKAVAKPVKKWGGQGIVFITDRGDGTYLIQADRTRKIVKGKGAAWRTVRRMKQSRRYIVQQYIPLSKAGSRPFDIRVMVQRHKKKPWVVTGQVAKIAGSGFLVTNSLLSRGTVVPMETALDRSSEEVRQSKEKITDELKTTSIAIAEKLGNVYPGIHTIGLDMGVDTKGNLWFIEANFTPMLSLFRRLPNKRMYRRIVAFHK